MGLFFSHIFHEVFLICTHANRKDSILVWVLKDTIGISLEPIDVDNQPHVKISIMTFGQETEFVALALTL